MLLGKRPRPPMRRNTSMTEFSNDQSPPDHRRVTNTFCAPVTTAKEPMAVAGPSNNDKGKLSPQLKQKQKHRHQQQQQLVQGPFDGMEAVLSHPLIPSPRNPRRHSGDFAVEAALFLRECGLCKRRLGPGRDTFMYRGEIAFCSLECRQQQMVLDERKEKCSMASVSKSTYKGASGTKPSATTEAASAAAI